MKLYTEEEVKRAIYLSNYATEEEVLAGLTPIELPSDEEIEKEAESWFDGTEKRIFNWGAKWVIEQIKQQDK